MGDLLTSDGAAVGSGASVRSTAAPSTSEGGTSIKAGSDTPPRCQDNGRPSTCMSRWTPASCDNSSYATSCPERLDPSICSQFLSPFAHGNEAAVAGLRFP